MTPVQPAASFIAIVSMPAGWGTGRFRRDGGQPAPGRGTFRPGERRRLTHGESGRAERSEAPENGMHRLREMQGTPGFAVLLVREALGERRRSRKLGVPLFRPIRHASAAATCPCARRGRHGSACKSHWFGSGGGGRLRLALDRAVYVRALPGGPFMEHPVEAGRPAYFCQLLEPQLITRQIHRSALLVE